MKIINKTVLDELVDTTAVQKLSKIRFYYISTKHFSMSKDNFYKYESCHGFCVHTLIL